jgi:hypothetical protein
MQGPAAPALQTPNWQGELLCPAVGTQHPALELALQHSSAGEAGQETSWFPVYVPNPAPVTLLLLLFPVRTPHTLLASDV